MKIASVVVGRRTVLVVAVLGAVAASMLLTALSPRVYRAEATVLLRDGSNAAVEAQLIGSGVIRFGVGQRLGIETLPPPARVTSRSGTQVVSIVVRSGHAATAAVVANTYAATYIDLRGPAPDISDFEDAVADLEEQIATLRIAIDNIDNATVTNPDDKVPRDLFVARLSHLELQLATLEADPTSLGDIDIVPAATIDEKATPPGKAEEPRPARTAGLAALAGLLIGVIAIGVAERSNDALRDVSELNAIRRRVPVIGQIPHDAALQIRPSVGRRRVDDTSYTSIHGLRDEVLLIGLEPPMRVIQVCAAAPGAGATTIATELAIALSEYSSVALIDLDLRSPEIHHMVGLHNPIGMVDNLDSHPIDLTLFPIQEGLDVIAAGRPPSSPLAVLSRVRLDTMMNEMRDRYDIVVIDSPDLESYGDATMIARLVDAVIVVARVGHTSTSLIRSACHELDSANARIMGFVINDMPTRR